MKYAALSDVGRSRQNNEDSYYVYCNVPIEGAYGGIVADGMGGYKAGELASKYAVDIIKQHIISGFHSGMDYMDIVELIRIAFVIANRDIYKEARKNEYIGMGTTATMALVYEDKLIVAHVGDSRCYRITDKRIEQITEDHSYVEELIKHGHISYNDVQLHPNKNIITRAIGAEQVIRVDTKILPYNGETIVLCSDGLTNMLSDNQIYNIINENDTYSSAVKQMITLANKKGGYDNITVILFDNQKGEKR